MMFQVRRKIKLANVSRLSWRITNNKTAQFMHIYNLGFSSFLGLFPLQKTYYFIDLLPIYSFSWNKWAWGQKVEKSLRIHPDPDLCISFCFFNFIFCDNQMHIISYSWALSHLVRSSMSTNMASCSMWSSSRISSNWTSSSFRPGASRDRCWSEAESAALTTTPWGFLCVCVCVLRFRNSSFSFPWQHKGLTVADFEEGNPLRVTNKLVMFGLLGISGASLCKRRNYSSPSTELADACRLVTVNAQGKLLTVKVFELTYRKVLSHPL